MQCGAGGDLAEEGLDVELGGDEGLLKLIEGVLAVGAGGLLDGVVKEVADEGAVAVWLGDDVIDDVAGAGEAEGLIVF